MPAIGLTTIPGSRAFRIADLPAQTAGPEETTERAEYVLEARERLSALKPAERRALGLIAAGFSYNKEIGQMSGWTYTKTNRSAAEGRAALRVSAAEVYKWVRPLLEARVVAMKCSAGIGP